MVGGVYLVLTGHWNWNVGPGSHPIRAVRGEHQMWASISTRRLEDKAKGVTTLPVLIGETAARVLNIHGHRTGLRHPSVPDFRGALLHPGHAAGFSWPPKTPGKPSSDCRNRDRPKHPRATRSGRAGSRPSLSCITATSGICSFWLWSFDTLLRVFPTGFLALIILLAALHLEESQQMGILYLGIPALSPESGEIIYRIERCDWSLFRLGNLSPRISTEEGKPFAFNILAVNFFPVINSPFE